MRINHLGRVVNEHGDSARGKRKAPNLTACALIQKVSGAGDEARTRDPDLGKVVLYH